MTWRKEAGQQQPTSLEETEGWGWGGEAAGGRKVKTGEGE